MIHTPMSATANFVVFSSLEVRLWFVSIRSTVAALFVENDGDGCKRGLVSLLDVSTVAIAAVLCKELEREKKL